MHEGVKFPIARFQLREDLVNLFIARNVALENSGIRQLPSQGFCFCTEAFILVANSNLRSGRGKLSAIAQAILRLLARPNTTAV